MELVNLGNTGIKVSKLCFGGLTIGPLQANLSLEKGASVICAALEMGVNFIDTAQLYETYQYIREAIKISAIKPVIASKSYAFDKATAKASLEQARVEMDLDVVDIFLLHEQESIHTLRGHREATEYFMEAKQKGLIKAFGISTHHVEAVKASLNYKEIEVIHPIINKVGLGICDGNLEDMLNNVKKAYNMGKGIYSMKPLGGGNLINSYNESIDFVRNLDCVHAIAVGMQTREEVIMNVCIFNGEKVPRDILEKVSAKRRKLLISDWCEACGKCVDRCQQRALYIDTKANIARVEDSKCVLCGYCSRTCPVFAIKIC